MAFNFLLGGHAELTEESSVPAGGCASEERSGDQGVSHSPVRFWDQAEPWFPEGARRN